MQYIMPMIHSDIVPSNIVNNIPQLDYVNPSDLYICNDYINRLSEKSIRLIKKIASEWQWLAFKPPTVTKSGAHLEVVDGYHTVIAAITHGGIPEIPVLIVDQCDKAMRASALVRKTRDDPKPSPIELYYTLLEAGDEDALTVHNICQRAKINILVRPPSDGGFQVGDTLALATIKGLLRRRYAMGARRVLAKLAPVSAGMIRAIEHLLYSTEYRNQITENDLPDIIIGLGGRLATEAKRFSEEHKILQWRAIASIIFMNRRKNKK
ncbi:hypothetical protein [Brucella gallinifaecis]|uniref:hypothetical protein n=1 Tax=Brucella gallinifaecis TaxID=215590 RepID=UPI00130E742A|nr:hypothetical protein [Brucella gallinifaecis]